MGAITIRNIWESLEASFLGAMAVFVLAKIYSVLDALTWGSILTKYSMKIAVFMFVFVVIFYIPFKKLTEWHGKKGEEQD